MRKFKFLLLLIVTMMLSIISVQSMALEECEHHYIVYREEPTCTSEGFIVHNCDKCGDYYVEYIPLTGHSWSDWETTTPASCEKQGEEMRHCKKCDYVETRKLDALEHTWGAWYTAKPADCITEGKLERVCSNCKAVETQSISPLGHIPSEWKFDSDSTCTTVGMKHIECKRCKQILQSENIPLKNHSYKILITKPTCTDDGFTTHSCTVCGQSYITDRIAAKGHTIVTDKAVKPTCTSSGNTEGKHCSVCGKTLIAKAALKPLGHSYSSSWTVDVAASCKKTGSKSHHCTRCGAKKDITKIEKTAHKTKNVVTDATEKKNGNIKTVCASCGYVAKTTVIPKIASIKLSKSDYTCNNKVKTPTVTIKDSKGKTLKKGTDYTVSYQKGRKSIGTYSVKVTFKGNYSGTKTLKFKIQPAKVTGIKASQTANKITLSWNKVTGAVGYRIYKYNTKTKKYSKLADTSKLSFTQKNLKAGTTYKYKIRAYGKSGKTIYWGAYSSAFTTTTKPSPPSIKLSSSGRQVKLTWNKVAGATGYDVYCKTGKGSYKKLGRVKGTSYTVKGLKAGQTYSFKVKAYKICGGKTVYGTYSNVRSKKIK